MFWAEWVLMINGGGGFVLVFVHQEVRFLLTDRIMKSFLSIEVSDKGTFFFPIFFYSGDRDFACCFPRYS